MLTFSERVLQIALSIPKGRVTTYGRIARAAGGGNMASQSITGILAKAWDHGEKNIPFHRIVYADGHIWIDAKHHKERMRRYQEEGIKIDSKNRIENFNHIVWELK